MAITDEEVQDLEKKEKDLARMGEEIQKKQIELSVLNGEFESLRNELREKYGVAPYDAATLASQIRILKKVLEKN